MYSSSICEGFLRGEDENFVRCLFFEVDNLSCWVYVSLYIVLNVLCSACVMCVCGLACICVDGGEWEREILINIGSVRSRSLPITTWETRCSPKKSPGLVLLRIAWLLEWPGILCDCEAYKSHSYSGYLMLKPFLRSQFSYLFVVQ